jgi:ribonuclease VapC
VVAVLDSSAVLALAKSEPGSATVVRYLNGAVMSSVNHAEVLHGLARSGIELELGEKLVATLQIEVLDFTARLAVAAAALGVPGAPVGLSLGDRACLATAADLGAPVVTADRVWTDLDLGVEVVTIR